jgi:NADH:ubiquinone oxidoreductase subunit 6 (subunit J)
VIVHVLIAWGAIAAAIALAMLVHTTRNRNGELSEDDLPDYSVVLGFVASAYGLLLGLLVVFSVGHHSDARHQAEGEAASLVSLNDTLAVYPREVRVGVRHDLVCYMRSIVADDWPSMERGNSTEAPRTLAFGDRIRADTRRLRAANDRQSSAYGRAATQITDATQARQQLLFFTKPSVPTALWVVVYVGAFLLVFLIAIHYTDHPRGRILALGCVTVLVTVVVSVLAVLDRPFGVGARVQPDEMRQALTLLSVGADPPVLRPCPALPQGLPKPQT